MMGQWTRRPKSQHLMPSISTELPLLLQSGTGKLGSSIDSHVRGVTAMCLSLSDDVLRAQSIMVTSNKDDAILHRDKTEDY